MKRDIQVSILNGIVEPARRDLEHLSADLRSPRIFARDREFNLRYRIFAQGTDIDSSHVQVRRSVRGTPV